MAHGSEGMHTLEDEDAGRSQRPWPVVVVQREQVGAGAGAFLPGEGWIGNRLRQWLEHRNGQHEEDEQRVQDHEGEHANLERMGPWLGAFRGLACRRVGVFLTQAWLS